MSLLDMLSARHWLFVLSGLGLAAVVRHLRKKRPAHRIVPEAKAILGWRGFYVGSNGELMGLTFDTVWSTDVTVAEHRTKGRCHGPYCDVCGLYAYKRYDHALSEAILHIQKDRRTAVGEVLFWGHVVEHERGYRAERGCVVRVWCEDLPLANMVARRYDIPAAAQEFVKPKSRRPNGGHGGLGMEVGG